MSATRAASLAVLIYAGHNAVAAGAAVVAGHWIDVAEPRRVLAAAAAVYVVAYLMLAASSSATVLTIGFLLSGVGIGLGETSQTAWLALVLPEDMRADGYGLVGLTQAAGDLGATLVAGLLWAAFSASAAFGYAATWMMLSLLVLVFMLRGTPNDLEGVR